MLVPNWLLNVSLAKVKLLSNHSSLVLIYKALMHALELNSWNLHTLPGGAACENANVWFTWLGQQTDFSQAPSTKSEWAYGWIEQWIMHWSSQHLRGRDKFSFAYNCSCCLTSCLQHAFHRHCHSSEAKRKVVFDLCVINNSMQCQDLALLTFPEVYSLGLASNF